MEFTQDGQCRQVPKRVADLDWFGQGEHMDARMNDLPIALDKTGGSYIF